MGNRSDVIADNSGNGRHMVIATAGLRQLHKTDVTRHWLLFDGVDDHFAVAFCGAANFDRFSAFRITNWTATRHLYSGIGNYNGATCQNGSTVAPTLFQVSSGFSTFALNPPYTASTNFVLQ